MAKPKKPKTKLEDEDQSRRFLDIAHELEAAGELSPAEDGRAFESLLIKAASPRKTTPET